MYDEADMDDMLLRAVVPDDGDSASSTQCICSRPDCEVCFPKVKSEFSNINEYSEAWLLYEEGCVAARRREKH